LSSRLYNPYTKAALLTSLPNTSEMRDVPVFNINARPTPMKGEQSNTIHFAWPGATGGIYPAPCPRKINGTHPAVVTNTEISMGTNLLANF
jgi:hypothetical protein